MRVIVVSTRAALRHAGLDGTPEEPILRRGRLLLDELAPVVRTEGSAADVETLDRSYAELDAMAQE